MNSKITKIELDYSAVTIESAENQQVNEQDICCNDKRSVNETLLYRYYYEANYESRIVVLNTVFWYYLSFPSVG